MNDDYEYIVKCIFKDIYKTDSNYIDYLLVNDNNEVVDTSAFYSSTCIGFKTGGMSGGSCYDDDQLEEYQGLSECACEDHILEIYKQVWSFLDVDISRFNTLDDYRDSEYPDLLYIFNDEVCGYYGNSDNYICVLYDEDYFTKSLLKFKLKTVLKD